MSALPNADLMRALRDLEAAVASSAWGTVTGVLSMLKSTPVTFASLKVRPHAGGRWAGCVCVPCLN